MINLIYIAAVILGAGALLFGIEILKKCGKYNNHLTRGMALLLAAEIFFRMNMLFSLCGSEEG